MYLDEVSSHSLGDWSGHLNFVISRELCRLEQKKGMVVWRILYFHSQMQQNVDLRPVTRGTAVAHFVTSLVI